MQNKIDRKYYVWIWLGLIFANYIRNVYGIYEDINVLIGEASRTQIVSSVFIMIFNYGIIPTVETFRVRAHLVLYHGKKTLQLRFSCGLLLYRYDVRGG